MMKTRNIISAVLIAMALPLTTHAAKSDSGVYPVFGSRHFDSRDINRLQERHSERIQQGIHSGELTRREAQRLIAEQRMIQRQERLYRADGVWTHAERRDLWQKQHAASRHIYNETHDAQERF